MWTLIKKAIYQAFQLFIYKLYSLLKCGFMQLASLEFNNRRAFSVSIQRMQWDLARTLAGQLSWLPAAGRGSDWLWPGFVLHITHSWLSQFSYGLFSLCCSAINILHFRAHLFKLFHWKKSSFVLWVSGSLLSKISLERYFRTFFKSIFGLLISSF